MIQTPPLPQRDAFGYPTRPGLRRVLRNVMVRTCKRILLAAVTLVMHAIGLFLRPGQRHHNSVPLTPETFHPRRILVLRLDLIGDLVLSLTLVHLLKRTYPDAEIDLLALPSSVKVVASDPDLATLIPYDPNIWRRPQALLKVQNWRELGRLRARLRERHYDLAVSAFGPWAAILALLSRAPRRVGFAAESYPGFMTDAVPGQHWGAHDRLHEVDYCLQLAVAAGATPTLTDRIPHLTVSPQALQEVTDLLSATGIQPHRPLIACHVSSNNGQSKRWPIPYWATLIDTLIADDQANVVLTGAPDDLPLISAMISRTRHQPFNLAGKTTLVQLAALFQQADMLVTGDSGPMHIAAAVGTLLIAIHGPTDPALSGPVSPHATILRSDIWCSPCYTAKGLPADCRFYTTQCMKDIQPAQVLQVLRTQLQNASTQKRLSER